MVCLQANLRERGAQQAGEHKTPSRREAKAASGEHAPSGRTAAQSPRGGQLSQSKGVLTSILSPVLTLFQSNKEESPKEPTVLLEVSWLPRALTLEEQVW